MPPGTRRGDPPAEGTVHSWLFPGGGSCLPVVPALSIDTRPEENAIVLPSGDHLGAPGLHASPTSSRGTPLPSVEVIQIEGTRLLRARSMRETT